MCFPLHPKCQAFRKPLSFRYPYMETRTQQMAGSWIVSAQVRAAFICETSNSYWLQRQADMIYFKWKWRHHGLCLCSLLKDRVSSVIRTHWIADDRNRSQGLQEVALVFSDYTSENLHMPNPAAQISQQWSFPPRVPLLQISQQNTRQAPLLFIFHC